MLKGGKGDDTLNAADGVSGNDVSRGGGGTDSCDSDATDVEVSCES